MAEVQTYSSATAQYWIKDLNSDWLTNKNVNSEFEERKHLTGFW